MSETVTIKEHFEKELQHLKELLVERDKQFSIIQEYNKQLEIKAETAVALALKQADQRMTDHNNILDKMETQTKTFPDKAVFNILADRVDKIESRVHVKESDKSVMIALIIAVGSFATAIAVAFLK